MPKTLSHRKRVREAKWQQELEGAALDPSKLLLRGAGASDDWHHVNLNYRTFPQLCEWSLACLVDALGHPPLYPMSPTRRRRNSYEHPEEDSIGADSLKCKLCVCNIGNGRFAIKLLFEDRDDFGFHIDHRGLKTKSAPTPPPRYQFDLSRKLLIRHHVRDGHNKWWERSLKLSGPLDPAGMLSRSADSILMPFLRSLRVPISFVGALAEALQESAAVLRRCRQQPRALLPIDGRLFFFKLLLLPAPLRERVADFLPKLCARELVSIRDSFGNCKFLQVKVVPS